MAISDLVEPSWDETVAFEPTNVVNMSTSSLSLSLMSPGTSVLNPVPLPQPLPSTISSARTPYAELELSDLTFQTIAAAALPNADLQSRTVPRPNVQIRRSQHGADLPILGLSNFPWSASASTHLPNWATATASLVMPGTTTEINRGFKQEELHRHQQQQCGQISQRFDFEQITPPAPLSADGEMHDRLMLPSLQPFALTTTPPLDTSCSSLQHSGDEISIQQDSQTAHFRDVPETLDSTTQADGSSSPNRTLSEDLVSEIVPSILSAIQPPSSATSHSQIRVMTHALPIPSLVGYCFPQIVAQIQTRLTPQRTTWISHWHAVSGRFNICQIPTTPPATPAAPHEGEDYFTIRTFDSAVSVPDYQQADITRLTVNASPRTSSAPHPPYTSPRPAVPPSSVHLSITERYIPPASPSEFVDMYDPCSGRSLLSDRLVELSDEDGVLLFIYPTKEGGKTFLKDYLGPALDPLLRRMMIVNNLGIDVCQELGGMNAASRLPTFEQFNKDIRNFCSEMSSTAQVGSPATKKFRSVTGKPVKLELIHAQRKEISLTADVWTDWWCRQEKPRIRKIFEKYLRQQPGRSRPSSSGGTINSPMTSRARLRDEAQSDGSSMTQILEILNGVETGARERFKHITPKGLEVGVFVIKKSKVLP